MRKIFILAILISISANAADKNAKLLNIQPKPKPWQQEIDLNLEENLQFEQLGDDYELPDLESDFSEPAPKRGDVSIKPKFEYIDPDDPTISDNIEKEKSYKLEFNIGL